MLRVTQHMPVPSVFCFSASPSLFFMTESIFSPVAPIKYLFFYIQKSNNSFSKIKFKISFTSTTQCSEKKNTFFKKNQHTSTSQQFICKTHFYFISCELNICTNFLFSNLKSLKLLFQVTYFQSCLIILAIIFCLKMFPFFL